MSGFWTGLREDIRDPVVIGSVTFLTLFLAIIGPFGSHSHLDFWSRLAFWVPVNAAGSIIGLRLNAAVTSRFPSLNHKWQAGLSAALSAICMCWPMLVLIERFLTPAGANLTSIFEVALLIYSSNLGICSLRWGWDRGPIPPHVVEPEPATISAPPRLVDRLDATIQGDIILVSGRDHYVDVVTQNGSASLLMRFSDALRELDPEAGMQVHRSHWVAAEHIVEIEKVENRQFLVMDSGKRVPLSKSHVEKVMSVRRQQRRRTAA